MLESFYEKGMGFAEDLGNLAIKSHTNQAKNHV